MNVTKMRKQTARHTPDFVVREFDAHSNFLDFEIGAWREQWAEKMRMKHGENFESATISVEDNLSFTKKRVMLQAHLVERRTRYGV